MAFVDAVHENDVQAREFEVLEPFMSDKRFVLFHDVMGCDLLPSIRELATKFVGIDFRVLAKTLSGLAVALKKPTDEANLYLDFFSADAKVVLGLETVLVSNWGEAKGQFFENVSLTKQLRFPDHPQL